MRHPQRRDAFRSFMVIRSIVGIVAIYLTITVVAASATNHTLFALHNGLTAKIDSQYLSGLYYYLFDFFGAQSNLPPPIVPGATVAGLIGGVYHTITVTLLLGAVVYKVMLPRTTIMQFRDMISLTSDSNGLETSFYSTTNLQISRLTVTCFFKWYHERLPDGSQNAFPMETIEISDESGNDVKTRDLPMPYNFVPTRVVVPIQVVSEISEQVADPKRPVTLVRSDDSYTLWVGDQEVRPSEGEFIELYVVVSGTLPQAPRDLIEVHSFDLHEVIKLVQAPSFDPKFDVEKKRYVINRWRDF